MEAMGRSGKELFECMTGLSITDEPSIDRLVKEGRIDPSEAEGWSMGDCMDSIVVRIVKLNLPEDEEKTISFVPTLRSEMLEAIDTPEHCRFSSNDISKIDEVDRKDAPPHIHNRRCNWTRWLRMGYDRNCVPLSNTRMYVFVFYENWVDSALYAGNVTLKDTEDAIAYMKDYSKMDLGYHTNLHLDILGELQKQGTMSGTYNDPDLDEVREKKAVRNRARRERRKERNRERATQKTEEAKVDAECKHERKQEDDGIEGIHKGKKGYAQLAEEEAECRRKELAKSHREWEHLHPKNERIVVCGESHTESPKVLKPEPTTEERVARMDFEEKRGDRRFEAEKKKADCHADKLRRGSEVKAKAERDKVKQVGMRIAEAANPKPPLMTFARKAGLF